ncbi:MAG TPA: helix-turn-helix domain-containing protein [Thermomicrobiales bacterium]|nr:helix-turn-helix domain-containing protein [Thermomicrobiales bacterium]
MMTNQVIGRTRPAVVDAGPRPAEPLLLRVQPDCTRITGPGKSTIFEAIARGELKATRFGRAVRIHRDDLEAWIAANRDSAA